MREIKEAEYWLESAKKIMAPPGADREKYTVIAAQCIHSIIRANDALTLQYLNKRAMRHDEAITLFLELIEGNKIPSKHSHLRKTLKESIQLKSRVDYKGTEISKSEAEKWIKKAENFLTAVKESLS